MFLRDLAGELFDVESQYAQTMRWLPGKGSDVDQAQKRMRVLEKIRGHPDTVFEVSDTPEFTDALNQSIDETVLLGSIDPSSETSAVDALVKKLALAHAAPEATDGSAEEL